MRLQLEVCRHRLPAIKILWQADADTIVSDLLSNVDLSIPLQSEEWGLEDYVLETATGFEALHYQKVGDVLREDDYLRVRPLSTNDLRARRLTARTQINLAGRHLTDGVAYGQPALRTPVRARLAIAPRKSAEWVSACDSSFEDPELVSEDEEQSDQDFDGTQGQEVDHSIQPQRKSTRLTRAAPEEQSSAMVLLEDEDDSEDESEDQDFDDSSDSGSSSSGASSSPLDEQAPARGRKRVHWAGDENQDNLTESDRKGKAQPSTSGPPPSKRVKVDTESSSGNFTEDHQQWQGQNAMKPAPKQRQSDSVAPGQGKYATRQRNSRRAATKKLRSLKSQGLLPPDAGHEALMQYEEKQSTNPPKEQSTTAVSSSESRDMSEEDSDESSDSDESESEGSEDPSDDGSEPSVTASNKPVANGHTPERQINGNAPREAAECQARREALLAQLGKGGGIDVTELKTPPRATSSNGVARSPSTQPVEDAGQDTPDSTGRHKKLDVRASTRLLLGSLGQRAPRNATERAVLVDKMSASSQKKPPATDAPKNGSMDPVTSIIAEKAKKDMKLKVLMKKVAAETATKDEREKFDQIVSQCREEYEASLKKEDKKDATDPDYWKQHIELTAVECCDEVVNLSTPPFPFYQRWDPSQRRQKKRKRRSQYEEELNDSYFGNGDDGGDGLIYDDEELLQGQEWDGIQDEEQGEEGAEIEDDLPPMPEDPSTLPEVKESDLNVGDVIVFKNLEVSAATGWTPAVSALRTAKVLNEKFEVGQPIFLQLAKRDLPERTYDAKGNRIYEKFEMQSGDEDVEDEGMLELGFGELVEPKLLSRAPTGSSFNCPSSDTLRI
ncbi:hypothetical protein KVT40_007663 [Elsinoe batatas]|uniref:DUF7357 domain-containing protein n=1 Tax=Elsinoe batatas TaxID=2601811 RepID=A0A8K0KV47_9PEZI|nr:hypothetical protein KVT40_007663 [Elsinoe batatas]